MITALSSFVTVSQLVACMAGESYNLVLCKNKLIIQFSVKAQVCGSHELCYDFYAKETEITQFFIYFFVIHSKICQKWAMKRLEVVRDLG